MSRPRAIPILLAAAAAAATLAPAAAVPAAETARKPVAAVRVGHLFTGEGTPGPGVVLLRDGKIAGTAKDLPAGLADRVVELPDAWATPGWVDASSAVSLAGEDAESTREITPCVRPLRAFDPAGPAARRALRAGTTAAFLAPGSRNVVGGIASVVKTTPGAGGAATVVRDGAALKIAFGQDPSTGNFPARGIPFSIYGRRPTTRMGVLAVLRDAWNLGRAAGPDSPDADLAALARAAAGEIPVRAHARTEEDIGTLLRVAGEWGFTPVLEGAEEAWKGPERLKKAGIGCVLGPLAYPVGGRGAEGTDPALRNAAILHAAGVPLALGTGGEPWRLREQAILAVRNGLPRMAALRAVTVAAADLCGAGERIGRFTKGADGDLVIFDGDPFEATTRVLLVVVDGTVVHETEAAR